MHQNTNEMDRDKRVDSTSNVNNDFNEPYNASNYVKDYNSNIGVSDKLKSSKALNVTVFYESLCIDCINLFSKQLFFTYNELKEHINLTLVPFGKAHVSIYIIIYVDIFLIINHLNGLLESSISFHYVLIF